MNPGWMITEWDYGEKNKIPGQEYKEWGVEEIGENIRLQETHWEKVWEKPEDCMRRTFQQKQGTTKEPSLNM